MFILDHFMLAQNENVGLSPMIRPPNDPSMKLQFKLAALFVLTFVVAFSISSYLWLNPKPEIPESWNLDEIVSAANRQADNVVESDILAWVVEEDDRPLNVESCILWFRLQHPSGKTIYRVCRLFRHPNWRNRWRLSDFGLVCKSPPTSSQILNFMDQTNWNWKVGNRDKGLGLDPATGNLIINSVFRFIDGRVCTNAWKRRTGQSFNKEVRAEFLR